jgi:hypothetical protein
MCLAHVVGVAFVATAGSLPAPDFDLGEAVM